MPKLCILWILYSVDATDAVYGFWFWGVWWMLSLWCL